ncbi:MAG: hypothetical protein M1815_001708 [Lichina confinis]|nr:MAG: hypothetical protein M1815_001708 [Lichina confinis]
MKSRWANDEEDAALKAQRKREKEEKKRLRAERQRRQEEEQAERRRLDDAARAAEADDGQDNATGLAIHPAKRRRLSPQPAHEGLSDGAAPASQLMRFEAPVWGPCRHVDNFEKLNHIEEGSYGWVSRAREAATGEVVALKKLKMDNANDGFPVTGLREIQTLMAARHSHIVNLREVVVGDGFDDVFLVMDFVEHDLKSLQEDMAEPFLASEIKTLLLQIVSATEYLHDNWILHRDLKTSNLLMNNRGQIKMADFGMARYYGDPPPKMTQLVVTLWYRAPELLLGTETYGKEIDMWSIGCIFGELLLKEPLLQGNNEVGQLSKIFELCGIPTEQNWPGFRRLPNARSLRLPSNSQNIGSVLRAKFPFLTSSGASLLTSLLSLNPSRRPTASDVLAHAYFKEDPKPKSSAMFPTFPSKAGQEKRRKRVASPSAPRRGDAAPRIDASGADFRGIFAGRDDEEKGAGWALKLI